MGTPKINFCSTCRGRGRTACVLYTDNEAWTDMGENTIWAVTTYGHNSIRHNYTGHRSIGHNYMDPRQDACVPYTDNEAWTEGMGFEVATPYLTSGHNYMGHSYVVDNYYLPKLCRPARPHQRARAHAHTHALMNC